MQADGWPISNMPVLTYVSLVNFFHFWLTFSLSYFLTWTTSLIGLKEIWSASGKGDHACKPPVTENAFRSLEWTPSVVFKELLLCLAGWFDACLTVLEIEVLPFSSLHWASFESWYKVNSWLWISMSVFKFWCNGREIGSHTVFLD
jgi:hypothetical protein